MKWLNTAQELRNKNVSFVIVTVTQVLGHSPRHVGSKMLVSAGKSYGTIGGGNLEKVAIKRANDYLAQKEKHAQTLILTLNPTGGDYGVQCCGGKVSLMFEPINTSNPSLAIFGAGHVAWALIHIMSLFPLDIYLVDSRKEQLNGGINEHALATLNKLHADIPESRLLDIPEDSHILIMTHNHAEDLAILDKVLRQDGHPFVGLIGSNPKWQHFKQELLKLGHSEKTLERVTTPIGLEAVPGRSPQAIAVAVCAQLLTSFEFSEGAFL